MFSQQGTCGNTFVHENGEMFIHDSAQTLLSSGAGTQPDIVNTVII